MHALSFDFGVQYIGVAVGDVCRNIVTPLMELKCSQGKLPLKQIDRLIQDWQPAFLIVGEALDENGKETAASKRCRAFGKRLERKTALKVFFVNEYLSSQHMRRLTDSKRVDRYAAALILEAFNEQYQT